MAVTAGDTEAARSQYAAAIALLEKAYDGSDAATILDALNTATIARYQRG